MKIPFGSRAPTETQENQLKRLGFDLSKMTKPYDTYFLEVPDNQKIQTKNSDIASDREKILVKYNGIEVIDIEVKTTFYDYYVVFKILEENIELALSSETPVIGEASIPEKEPLLTEYQTRLDDRLRQLDNIIFRGGAQRGYGSWISGQFPYLLELRKENPEEHDKFIASKESYSKLSKMFPNWTDSNNLQRNYQAIDEGALTAAASVCGRQL